MLRNEGAPDCATKNAFKGTSVAEKLGDTRQSHGSTHVLVPIESPTAKPRSRTSRTLREMITQDPATPISPVPPTPTSTRKRITRFSIFPILLPEDFPVSALIRRAHIRRRRRVQATRIRPLPPLPGTAAVCTSHKPSQRSTNREGKIRPLPAIPCAIPEGSNEGDCRSESTDAVEDTWRRDPERHAIALALQLSTDLCPLQPKLEKHDEHFLYDPQLFPRPSTCTTSRTNPGVSVLKPPTASQLTATSPFVTISPTSDPPAFGTPDSTSMARQRCSSAPDYSTLPPLVRPLTHARSQSVQVKLELAMDPGVLGSTAVRMPHPPSSFRGGGRGGATKADGTLTLTECIPPHSIPDLVKPPLKSSTSLRSESEPESEPTKQSKQSKQSKQNEAGMHSRVLVDRSVPDTPVGGWFYRGAGRAPTPIDWELLDTALGTKGTWRKSFSSISMKTLESLERESIPRGRKDSSNTTTSRSSRSRSRGNPKGNSSIPFALRKLGASKWMPFGREGVPPLPSTNRTWA